MILEVKHDPPGVRDMPEFAKVSFACNARRLKTELSEYIVPSLRDELIKIGWGIESAWIALSAILPRPAVVESLRSGHRRKGFVIAASWFPPAQTCKARSIEFVSDPTGDKNYLLSRLFTAAIQTGYLIQRVRALTLTIKPHNNIRIREIDEAVLAAIRSMRRFPRKSPKHTLPLHYVVNTILNYAFSAAKVRQASRYAAVSAEDLVEELCDAYSGEDWSRDFAGQLATNLVKPIESSVRIYGTGRVREGIRPRDLAIEQNVLLIVASRNMLRRGSIEGHSDDIAFARQNGAVATAFSEGTDAEGKILVFEGDLDFAARFILESIGKRLLISNRFAALGLVPIQVRGQKESERAAHAILGVILSSRDAMIRCLIEKRASPKRVAKQNQLICNALLDAARQVASSHPVTTSVRALQQVFTSAPESIDIAISGFDRAELSGHNENKLKPMPGTRQHKEARIKDIDLIRRLESRKRNAAKSAIKHPLDAFCRDIFGFMQELLASVGWDGLILPVERFARQEQLLLGPEEHRDHYLHTLKIFLFGRRLLIRMGCYNAFTRPRWILASVLHDVCYPIQMTEDWLDRYLQEMAPRVSGSVTTDGYLTAWDAKGYEICWFDALLRTVDARLSNWLVRRDGVRTPPRFQANALYNLLRTRNHAVLGAASLLVQASRVVSQFQDISVSPEWLMDDTDDRKKPWNATGDMARRSLVSQVFDAATAIILHDPGVWGALSDEQKDITFSLPSVGSGSEYTPNKCELGVASVVWTLAVADVVQEWGRDLAFGLDSENISDFPDWRTPWLIEFVPGEPAKRDLVCLYYPADYSRRVELLAQSALELLRWVVHKTSESLKIIPQGADIRDDPVRPWVNEGRRSTVWHCASVVSSIWEILGGKYDTRSATWLLALSRFLEEDKESTEIWDYVSSRAGGRLADSPFGSKLSEFATKIRTTLREVRMDPEKRATLQKMRRVHGFWRIPWRAMGFWKSPNGYSLRIERYIAKTGSGEDLHTRREIIDQIPDPQPEDA